jgi:hypothetical protein
MAMSGSLAARKKASSASFSHLRIQLARLAFANAGLWVIRSHLEYSQIASSTHRDAWATYILIPLGVDGTIRAIIDAGDRFR